MVSISHPSLDPTALDTSASEVLLNQNSSCPDSVNILNSTSGHHGSTTIGSTSSASDVMDHEHENAQLLLNVATVSDGSQQGTKRTFDSVQQAPVKEMEEGRSKLVRKSDGVGGIISNSTWLGNKRIQITRANFQPRGGDEVVLLVGNVVVGSAILQANASGTEDHVTSLHNKCLSQFQLEGQRLVVIYKCTINGDSKAVSNPYNHKIGIEDLPKQLGDMNASCFYPWDLNMMKTVDSV